MIEVPRPPSAQDIVKYRAKGWWKDQTFSQILETRGRETPDREAMSDARRLITYGQLWAEVRRFAEFLRRQDVQRGRIHGILGHPGASARDLDEGTGFAPDAGLKLPERGEQQSDPRG